MLDHFSVIDDPREPWRVAHPLPEVLSLVVYGTIADCDDYDHIAAWGDAHLPFLHEILPYHHGKTSRRSHDRGTGRTPLHLVSAFATTARLVLGQEAVGDKSNEITAIPVLVERLAANGGLTGASVSELAPGDRTVW